MQTKALHFIEDLHVIKDNLFPVTPPPPPPFPRRRRENRQLRIMQAGFTRTNLCRVWMMYYVHASVLNMEFVRTHLPRVQRGGGGVSR